MMLQSKVIPNTTKTQRHTPCLNSLITSALSANKLTSVARKIVFVHNKRNRSTSPRSQCVLHARQSALRAASSRARRMEPTLLSSNADSAAIWLNGSVGAPLISAKIVTNANARVTTFLKRSLQSCPSAPAVKTANSASPSTHQTAKNTQWAAQFAEMQRKTRRTSEQSV